MKVMIGITRMEYYYGSVEMTKEQYEQYREMSEMDFITSMLMKKSIKKLEDDWCLEHPKEFRDER